MSVKLLKRSALALAIGSTIMMASAPALASQAGSIKGKVTAEATGNMLSGVKVTARGDTMPKPRTTTTKSDGSFNIPLLKPGNYELTFEALDGSVKKVNVVVVLDQASRITMVMQDKADSMEVITVSGTALVREGDSSLTNTLGQELVEGLPVGQTYRDVLKLIPGVQVTENSTLGPAAGGSGRDNKYGFDGVDISLPMFGNLSSEPSTHDIANVSIDRGGANAKGFNRSGGFSINTISKSGTNEFTGNVEYKVQPKSLVADKDDADGTEYTLNKSWLTASIAGPIIKDELFFYGSYYRPETTRDNKETAYGPAKDYKSTRDEVFGKFTWQPTEELEFEASYRHSDRETVGGSVGAFETDSASVGDSALQTIFTLGGKILLGDYTTLDFQYSDWQFDTSGRPDVMVTGVNPTIGGALPIDMLDKIGYFNVPNVDESLDGYDNAGAQALIDQYGYISDETGLRTGGGGVGSYYEINDQDFGRSTFQVNLGHELELGDTVHYLHFGFQMKEGEEVLRRTSNGWGSISYKGGLPVEVDGSDDAVGAYYIARIQQMSLNTDGGAVPPIVSSTESFNFEINDIIEWKDFTFNLGVMISNDTLYGQGLKEDSSTVSGFVESPGTKYKMHEIEWQDMIQPRLGVKWLYDGENEVFANYSQYNPEASSLARAASWARNSQKEIQVMFDEQGQYLGNVPASGSSGKFFQEGIKPKTIDEIIVGTNQILSDSLMLSVHARYRETTNAWEDTWNGSRTYEYPDDYNPFGGVPAHIAAKGLYIPELDDYRDQLGSGSSYVIAQLDDMENNYYEVSTELTYETENLLVNASYTWSEYTGNYDQDITSGSSDANLFIGSSNLADGRGRQLWDGKQGRLNGDIPHLFKAYGIYTTSWDAKIGAMVFYQSGDVWEKWDGNAYGDGWSSTIRYAEQAGSRREDSHYQLDLSYVQNFDVIENYDLEFRADIFNALDNQTGYNYDPYASNETFGEARNLISPRRVQLSFNLKF